MPDIHICRSEKMCCNCGEFVPYILVPRKEALFVTSIRNQGMCKLKQGEIRAINKGCVSFTKRSI